MAIEEVQRSNADMVAQSEATTRECGANQRDSEVPRKIIGESIAHKEELQKTKCKVTEQLEELRSTNVTLRGKCSSTPSEAIFAPDKDAQLPFQTFSAADTTTYSEPTKLSSVIDPTTSIERSEKKCAKVSLRSDSGSGNFRTESAKWICSQGMKVSPHTGRISKWCIKWMRQNNLREIKRILKFLKVKSQGRLHSSLVEIGGKLREKQSLGVAMTLRCSLTTAVFKTIVTFNSASSSFTTAISHPRSLDRSLHHSEGFVCFKALFLVPASPSKLSNGCAFQFS